MMKLPNRFLVEVKSNLHSPPSPRSTLVTLGELIAEQTEHHVIGVAEYRKTTFEGIVLGDGIQRLIYDFILSAPALGYRYYLFQIQYQADPNYYYPVSLTIDTDIAEELHCSVEIACNNTEAFEAQLEQIMAAHKTIALVRSLYQHSQAEQSGSLSTAQ